MKNGMRTLAATLCAARLLLPLGALAQPATPTVAAASAPWAAASAPPTVADAPPTEEKAGPRTLTEQDMAKLRASMARDKVRIRFRKDGDLRLVSHHDLLRCLERMLRRAALPFHSTSGFHPKPRLVFALSLPLGIIGRDEVLELELDEALSPEEIHERLARQAPPGLELLSTQRIDPKRKAQVRSARYHLPLPPERAEV